MDILMEKEIEISEYLSVLSNRNESVSLAA